MDETEKWTQLVETSARTTPVFKPGFEGIPTHRDPIYGETRLRGRATVLSYEEFRALAASRVAPDDYGVFWGGAYLPSQEATNFCILGIPGSGKTTLMRLLMQSVLPIIGLRDKSKAHAQWTDPRYFARRHGVENPQDFPAKIESHRALIFDVKPEYLNYIRGMHLNGPVRILDPYHTESCVWDMGKDIDDTKVRTFAKIFIPDSSQGEGGGDRFFLDAARDVVALALTALNRSRQEWTLCDFVELMKDDVRYTEAINEYPDLARALRQAQARQETFQNVVQQIRTLVAEIEPASDAWKRAKTRVSLREWLEREEILVLARKEQYRESVDPIYRIMFGIAASLALSYPDSTTRRTWFFLDELGNAGELTNLNELMALGRAKGVAVVIGAQGIPTLQRVFKSKEKVTEILELCAYTAILRAGDGAEGGTAAWAERVLGKYEFYETKFSPTLSRAYTTGSSQTHTQGKSATTNTSQAMGSSQTDTSSVSKATTKSHSHQTGTGRAISISTGHSPGGYSSGRSVTNSSNSSDSYGESHSVSTSDGQSLGTSETNTRGSSMGTNESVANAISESEARTNAIAINRDRLEKSLVLASQIASLKTLKYDGMLVGYFIAPNAVYSLALPGAYLDRALYPPAPGDHYAGLAPALGLKPPNPLTPQEEEALLAARVNRAAAQPIREIDPL